MEFLESEFLIETKIPKDELIISRTDLRGNITYANETFARISGYEIDELIGQSHNILRHPDMPKRVFRQLWETLSVKEQWQGVVKNLRKDRGFYWVHATISGVYKDDKLVEYKSIRVPISFEQKVKYQKLYDEYRNVDRDNIRIIKYIS
ncbi:PAS domain-containing protein [Halarcobacter bivalviorum]|uniref:Chemotaxis protein n=1 Tax=Halarcobacter bivalviorum TaxID=663364 RepID=A0AAX2A6C7_9BACT|nr:PAS domain-containing protein [Halarcobacter bivalviorum]AXH13581.1 PAS sensor-containing signal transduction protein [Halarcobacter bivalviorum]RXK09814.1 chemotaxis protein [Halarcobacter bivalviorum]